MNLYAIFSNLKVKMAKKEVQDIQNKSWNLQ